MKKINLKIIILLGTALNSYSLHLSQFRSNQQQEELREYVERLDARPEEIEKSLKNINLHKKLSYGDTLLHRAAQLGNLAILKYLIDKDLDINSMNPYGYTPLHEVIFQLSRDLRQYTRDPELDLEKIRLLISKNADLAIKTKYGDTPLDLALKFLNSEEIKSDPDKKYMQEAVDILKAHQEKIRQEIHTGLQEHSELPKEVACVVSEYVLGGK